MPGISAEEDEGFVWLGPNEAGDVPNGMAGNVENVELLLLILDIVREADLSHRSAFEGGFLEE